jgi:hypothetical protein
MDPNISTFYLGQGVLGVTVLVLVYVVIKLYNKNEEKQSRIEELQDLRLQDSKEVTKDVTAVLQGNSQSNLILAEKIDAAKRRGSR